MINRHRVDFFEGCNWPFKDCRIYLTMCGICGILGLEDKELIAAMMEAIRHRGPDDFGMHIDKGISLGHRRLSIIDLSARGRQPMSNEDGSVWITFNGEVFNFRELRRDLEAAGHEFSSDTDTEVIVHAYEEHGLDFVKLLRGQFAFGLWDSSRKRLVLARDRLGIRPLYYAKVGGAVLFASEIKSLLEYDRLKPVIDYHALDNYLTFQYIPEPDTILEGVKKLPPATIMVLEAGQTRQSRYWDLRLDRISDKGEAQIVRELQGQIEEAVRLRLVSDVPLGVHLSGGIDSSAITAVMSSLVKEPVKTFSIGYGQGDVDETAPAGRVAEYLGTDHRQIYVDAQEVLGELENIIWHLDEPVGDPSQIPEYFLAKHTKPHVTVVFNGGGSDEVFAGYRAYRYLLSSEKIRRAVVSPLRGVAAAALGALPMPARHRRYVEYVGAKDNERVYWGQGLLFDRREKAAVCSKRLLERTAGNEPVRMIKRHFDEKAEETGSMLSLFSYVDLKGWVTGNCLSKLDRVMMAHAVECRVPFLDHKLVEFAMTIPPALKLRGGVEKYVLRKAMAGRLPKETLSRKKKGFGVPTDRWLFDDVNPVVSDRLAKSRFIRDNFNADRIRYLLKDTTDFRHSSQLFGLLVLDMWQERYIPG